LGPKFDLDGLAGTARMSITFVFGGPDFGSINGHRQHKRDPADDGGGRLAENAELINEAGL
jgi:hypothetical protein